MKLTVLTDMDDTMENLLPAWINILNRKAGTNVDPDEVTDWYIPVFFPSLPEREVFNVLDTEELWKDVRPKPDAQKYVKQLIDDGHRVFVVTTAGYKTVVPKVEHVLFRYFPFFHWNDVVITADKSIIRGDVLIDDGVHNLLNGMYEKILMDAPHNRSFDERKIPAVRVYNWEQAYDEVNKIAEKRKKALEECKKSIFYPFHMGKTAWRV